MINPRVSFIWFTWALFLMLIVDFFFPASFWFSVGRVHVNDAIEGVAPTMEVDRTIHRGIAASWSVELERASGDSFEFNPPRGAGDNTYQPDNALPADLDLDWWSDERWRPSPGRYRIETCWTLYPTWLTPRTPVCATSNTFTVYARDG